MNVKFEGMPTLRSLIEELRKASLYVPEYAVLADLKDNDSADPERREFSFVFKTETP